MTPPHRWCRVVIQFLIQSSLQIGYHGLTIHEFTTTRKLVWSSPNVLKHHQYYDSQESTKNVYINTTKQSITKTCAILSNGIQLYSIVIAFWIKTCCTCATIHIALLYDDAMTWTVFRITGPLWRESTSDFAHKWPTLCNFGISVLLACASCWTKNRFADDIRRHDAHAKSLERELWLCAAPGPGYINKYPVVI